MTCVYFLLAIAVANPLQSSEQFGPLPRELCTTVNVYCFRDGVPPIHAVFVACNETIYKATHDFRCQFSQTKQKTFEFWESTQGSAQWGSRVVPAFFAESFSDLHLPGLWIPRAERHNKNPDRPKRHALFWKVKFMRLCFGLGLQGWMLQSFKK